MFLFGILTILYRCYNDSVIDSSLFAAATIGCRSYDILLIESLTIQVILLVLSRAWSYIWTYEINIKKYL